MQIANMLSLLFFILIIIPLIENLIIVGGLLFITALILVFLISNIFGAWFSLILFLIYVTGLLVLFRYMLALRPNLHHKNLKLRIIALAFCSVVILNKITNIFNTNNETVINYSLEVSALFGGFNMSIYWLLALVLLCALILVVFICFKSPRPLWSYLQ